MTENNQGKTKTDRMSCVAVEWIPMNPPIIANLRAHIYRETIYESS